MGVNQYCVGGKRCGGKSIKSWGENDVGQGVGGKRCHPTIHYLQRKIEKSAIHEHVIMACYAYLNELISIFCLSKRCFLFRPNDWVLIRFGLAIVYTKFATSTAMKFKKKWVGFHFGKNGKLGVDPQKMFNFSHTFYFCSCFFCLSDFPYITIIIESQYVASDKWNDNCCNEISIRLPSGGSVKLKVLNF